MVAPGEHLDLDPVPLRRRQGMGDDPRLPERGGFDRFLDAIDWGWFFFLTKPIFCVLHLLNG